MFLKTAKFLIEGDDSTSACWLLRLCLISESSNTDEYTRTSEIMLSSH